MDPLQFGDQACVISINEPHNEEGLAKLWQGWYKIHVTEFWDIIKEKTLPVFRKGELAPDLSNLVTEQDIEQIKIENETFPVVTEEQIKAIADFIKENWENTIIVHCRAGKSRSAAVVKILMELGWTSAESYGKDGQKIYLPDLSMANSLVYTLLRRQFPQLLPSGAEK